MIDKVRDAIERHGMLQRGATVIVAVSGGADSAVLLHLLNRLKEELSLKLVVCHLNHNLRGRESTRDMSFVKALAAKLGLRFAGKTLAKGELKGAGSLQDAAREKRYAFLEETARKYRAEKVALGHTMDDQAETVLMRLLKGSSLKGLSGIAFVRGPYVRPLLDVPRKEIEEYAAANGVAYVTDSSNLTDKYLRNDIRLNLIPYLRKNYNPNIIETLARTASALASDNDYLERETRRVLPEAVLDRKKDRIMLDRERLAVLHEAISARLFLAAVGHIDKNADISSVHVESFRNVVKGKKPNATADLPGLKVTREYGRVILSKAVSEPAVSFSATLKVPGTTKVKGAGAVFKTSLLRKPPARFASGPLVAYFDYDEVPGPVIIRQMIPGDRIVPFGMKGHRKLKDIFIDKKVPKPLRQKVPVLSSGDVVIWAAGIRQSELCKVKKTTRRVLKVEVSEL